MNGSSCRRVNWIDVAISTVHAREGLFLVRQLDLEKGLSFPSALVDFERRMRNEK